VKTLNLSQQNTAHHIPEKRQVDDKPKIRGRIRSGEGTVAYWKSRLFRNSYRAKDGRTIELPEYYVRLRRDGLTKRVRLHTSEKDQAAEEALQLSEALRRSGWSAIVAGQARLPSSPSIDAFCEAYKGAAASMERPPRPISVNQYLRHLRQICTLAGVKNLRELTPEAIERGRDKYRALGRAASRSDGAIQNSLGIIVRNAAACFSKESRSILARKGLEVENPFAGIPRGQKIEATTSLPREIVDRIWKELPLLRDGNPEAESPNLVRFSKNYRKAHGGRKARWLPIDYRKPHPEAYCAILLGLGLGLRANEIDKARWSWFRFDGRGACFLEVREESDFAPKGGTMRVIRVPVELHEELSRARADLESPYVLGGQSSDAVKATGWGYRRRDVLRVANSWLRERGIEAEDVRGNPLHRLRKQFGSEVATGFGLFAAQKLLGHSSPTVTAKYYAAQTELPQLTHVRVAG